MSNVEFIEQAEQVIEYAGIMGMEVEDLIGLIKLQMEKDTIKHGNGNYTEIDKFLQDLEKEQCSQEQKKYI